MPGNEIPLSRLPVGRSAKVTSLLFEPAAKRRLNDLGVIDGTEIKALYASPFGNPVAYLIRGAVIALRTDVSQMILVNSNE